MASRFHAAKQRRAERSAVTDTGLNLIPLVDVLVSILFFTLLTYTGATSLLTAFDLRLPPTVVTEQDREGRQDEELTLLMTVRIEENGIVLQHTGGDGRFRREWRGITPETLDDFQRAAEEVRAEYPDNDDVTIIPDDATTYDNVIGVLERLRLAGYPALSLTARARQARAGAAGARPGAR